MILLQLRMEEITSVGMFENYTKLESHLSI